MWTAQPEQPQMQKASTAQNASPFGRTSSFSPQQRENSQAQPSPGRASVNPTAPTAPDLPSISVPKGGGAIRGMGEKSSVNSATGTVTASIPINVSKARSEFEPKLSLQYQSSTGNGPFGFGWQMSTMMVTRRTDRGVPRYQDELDSDSFMLSGYNELVPVLERQSDGAWKDPLEDDPPRVVEGISYKIRRYTPRVGVPATRIERWISLNHGDSHWRVITGDNITTILGDGNESRIFDPKDPNPNHPIRVFSWLASRAFDDRGNAMKYVYKAEDSSSIDLQEPYEEQRQDSRSTNRYLKRIKYGNTVSTLIDPNLTQTEWMFELVLDYGDHNLSVPTSEEQNPWPCRRDPFSVYRAGFEIRQYRLVHRILMFHNFPHEADVGPNCLVSSTDLTYGQDEIQADDGRIGKPRGSFIISGTAFSYKRTLLGYDRAAFPSIDFGYSQPIISSNIVDISPESLENLPAGLSGSDIRWVDLHGEGISGMLLKNEGIWMYKPNLGDGKFGTIQVIGPSPSASPATQLIDLDNDGSLDLVNLASPNPGFYKGRPNAVWENFQTFKSMPSIDWKDPNMRFLDLTGDGLPDVVLSRGEMLTWYPSLGEHGFGEEQRRFNELDALKGPRLVFADPTQAIFTADMTGDGLVDLVRVDSGCICYWPNTGYGQFGGRITMANCPLFDSVDIFDRGRIRMVDVDGSGTTDLIYLGSRGAHIYFNECGNSWDRGSIISAVPTNNSLTAINAVDLLGSGTTCLVWSSPLPSDAGLQMRYVDLMGTVKPHLLTSLINNLGAETKFNYSSSPKYYLKDKLEGTPWISPVPFAVHVVESVETYDRLSRNHFTTRYEYHHGHYNGKEREFSGFGRVDQYDTEQFGTLKSGATNHDEQSQMPPLVTRTWFHTGEQVGVGDLSDQFKGEYYHEAGINRTQQNAMFLTPSVLPSKITLPDESTATHTLLPRESSEALYSLKGSVIRQEIYALDAPFHRTGDYQVSDHPYAVTHTRFNIGMTQPRGESPSHYAVFFVSPLESVTFHYERRLFKVGSNLLADPRVTHDLTLSTNIYGQPLRKINIAYPRRHKITDDERFADDLEPQYRLSITATESTYTKGVSEDDDFRVPMSAEERVYEIGKPQLDPGDPFITNLLSIADAKKQLSLVADGTHDLPYEDVNGNNALQDVPYRRLISHARKYYRSDDLSRDLNLGELQSRAIPSRTLTMVSTPSVYQEPFVASGKASLADLNNMLLNDSNFIHSEGDNNWWLSSGKIFYSPQSDDSATSELQFAKQHFFTARRYQTTFHSTSFNTETKVEYDNYDLLMIQTSDPMGNVVTLGERRPDNSLDTTKKGVDYRVIQPKLVMDSNRNRMKVAFDVRGMVVGTAFLGKPEESIGDDLSQFDPDLSDAAMQSYLENPVANAQALLGSASTRILYDLFAYKNSESAPELQPVCTSTIVRETHLSDLSSDTPSEVSINFAYSDGFGRQMQAKVRVGSGPVPKRDANGNILLDGNGNPTMTDTDVSRRWICEGWTIFDNKGNPVQHFEPYFTDRHHFEFDVRIGVSPIMFYDPLGRPISTLNPDHTFTKVVFDPWMYISWDTGDTVMITNPDEDPDVGYFFSRLDSKKYSPGWYERRINGGLGPDEQKAAAKSAIYAKTPNTTYFDPLGRTIFAMGHIHSKYSDTPQQADPIEDFQTMAMKYDIQGRQIEILDTLKRTCARNRYDMLGAPIYQATMDGGERWTLFDAINSPVYHWNSRGYRVQTTYDQLRRPTREILQDQSGQKFTISKHEYGESSTTPETRNLRGKLVSVSDQSGKVFTEDYNFKGNLLKTSRQFAVVYDKTLDWSSPTPLEEGTTYSSISTYDAFGRMKDTTMWDKTIIRLSYDIGGPLISMKANLRGSTQETVFVKNMKYDANSRRTAIEYGNKAVKNYSYDRLSSQLTDIVSTRPRATLQNLHYVFDAANNIVYIKDSAQQTMFSHNQVVNPDNDYTYDSIGRLIEATGREHLGQSTGPRRAPGAFNDFQSRVISPNDPGAMARYLERYKYSSTSNLLSIQHEGNAQSPGWTRTYEYGQINQNNRLTSTAVGNSIETYGYVGNAGLHGNMTSMPHLAALEWNFMDQMQATAKTVINNGGTPEKTWYQYEGKAKRVRKVTESQTAPGQQPKRLRERIYLGMFEIYRKYESDGKTIALERTTLNINDDKDQVARVDFRTQGTEAGVPQEIHRWQLTNHLRSASLELDDDANVASYEEYTPFGSTSYYMVENDLEVPKMRRWNNKERDEENGFYYFGARYYAPWIGRWTSADPIGIGDGLNVFTYVSNNPIMRTDPTGTESKEVEVLLDEIVLYADKILDKASVGQNVQKDHTIAQAAIKKILGPILEKLYNKTHDLTVAAETGKGKWHTIKSTLEAAIRDKLAAGEIKTLNELVDETVSVLLKANAEVGIGSTLTKGQYVTMLQQLGNIFKQMTPEQAAQMYKMMEAGDTAGMRKMVGEITSKAVDLAKDRALAASENLAQRAQQLTSAPGVKTAIQDGEKLLEEAATVGKPLLQDAAAAAKAGGGSGMYARGGGIALGMLMFAMAQNQEERVDAVIGMVGGELIARGPGPVRWFGVGVLVGQQIEHSLSVSTYAAQAGMWANQKVREHGGSENTAFGTGLVVTIVVTPSAIGYAAMAKLHEKWPGVF